jgi:hypothetical protein
VLPFPPFSPPGFSSGGDAKQAGVNFFEVCSKSNGRGGIGSGEADDEGNPSRNFAERR